MPHVDDRVGWQGTDTSYRAAEDMALRAGALRLRVLHLLRDSLLPMTAEEIAYNTVHDAVALRGDLDSI